MSNISSSTESIDDQPSSSYGKRKANSPTATTHNKGKGAQQRQAQKQQIKFNERTYQSVKQDLKTSAIRFIGISDRDEIERMQRQFVEWDKLLAEGKPINFSSATGGVVVSNNEVEIGLDMSEVKVTPNECELDSRDTRVVDSPLEVGHDIHESLPVEASHGINVEASAIPIDSVTIPEAIQLPVDAVIDPFDELIDQVSNMDVSVETIANETPTVESTCVEIYRCTNGEGFSNCIPAPTDSPVKRAKVSGRQVSITSVSRINGLKYAVTYHTICQHLYTTHVGTGIHIIRRMEDKYLYRVSSRELIVWMDDG